MKLTPAEALFMGLRLKEGVSLAAFRSEYGVDVIERYGDELPGWPSR